MHVKMHTIKAGPNGCSDAGAVIPVTQSEGLSLIAAGAAKKFTLPGNETAAIDPQAMAERERVEAENKARRIAEEEGTAKSVDNVRSALSQLDMSNDEDWTGGGKPAMDRVKSLTGSKTLTRAELDVLAPEFVRIDPRDGQDAPAVPPTPNPAKDAGPATASKARSTAP